MKTSVNLVRKLENYEVIQRSCDGYFDANVLLRNWNLDESNPSRKISRFLDSPKTKEFVSAIVDDNSPSAEMHNGDFKAVIKINGRNTKNGRTNDQVWMHPYLFIDFAMWINPKFKLQVIKFVYDQLIELRNEIGDKNNTLMDSISSIVTEGYQFAKVNEAINWIALNNHYTGIRNTITPEQAKLIREVQEKIKFSVDVGFVKSYHDLLMLLRKMYADKTLKPF